MHSHEDITIPIPGLTLAAKVWGPKDGKPVLALHGWQDNAATFDMIAPLLPRLRIVALDLTGHGLSDHRPVGVGYTFLDWVIDVHAAVGELGWDRFSILAHSLGAGIANAFAATWPDRVERIAAIDGFAPRVDEPEHAPQRLADCVAGRERVARSVPRVYADISAAADRLRERIAGLPHEGALCLAVRGTRGIEGGVTWRRDPRIGAGPPMRLDREQILAFLRGVQCPVLLIRPLDGWPVTDAVLDEIREALRGMRVEKIDGGHHVHLERPMIVAKAVRPFLEQG